MEDSGLFRGNMRPSDQETDSQILSLLFPAKVQESLVLLYKETGSLPTQIDGRLGRVGSRLEGILLGHQG